MVVRLLLANKFVLKIVRLRNLLLRLAGYGDFRTLILISTLIIALHVRYKYFLIQNLRLGSEFADYSYMTSYADCFHFELFNAYKFPNTCANIPYIYGVFALLLFYPLTLHAIPADIVVTLLFISFVLLLLMRIVPLGTRWLLYLTALLLSPPIFLLYERGNIDIVIAIAILLAVGLLTRGNFFAGLVLLAALSLLKFYLLPSLFCISLIFKGFKFRYMTICILTLIGVIGNLTLIQRNYLPSIWENSFGLSTIISYAAIFNLGLSQFQAALLISSLIASSIYLLNFTHSFSLTVKQDWETYLFVICGSSLILSTIVGNYFDYRLFLVIFCVPFCISNLRGHKILTPCFFIAVLLSFFLSNPLGIGNLSSKMNLIVSMAADSFLFFVITIICSLLVSLLQIPVLLRKLKNSGNILGRN